MKFKQSLVCAALSGLMSSTVIANNQNVQLLANVEPDAPIQKSVNKKINDIYIVHLKGVPGIQRASDIGELLPSNQIVAFGNRYNAESPRMIEYVESMKAKQQAVAGEIGNINIIYNYLHTMNGFAAKLTDSQVAALRNHPDVAEVSQNRLDKLHTANTPAFLGLTDEGGQHSPEINIKGEDIVIGVLDSGVWPENPSFASDGLTQARTYGPAPLGWNGACNEGTIGTYSEDGVLIYSDETTPKDETFTCNNKLIGARYYGAAFSDIPFEDGEFVSPRDADGHGSHTASTAGGNAGIEATINGADLGTISGIAPRARIAVYKVCWPGTCSEADRVAAIDQAVLDGVDVINHSIGNQAGIGSINSVNIAALRAAEAGILFVASAGNSGGDGPASVRNNMPWMATVGNSTYDGTSANIGTELEITIDDAEQEPLFSVLGGINAPIPEEGLSFPLMATGGLPTPDLGEAEAIHACSAIDEDFGGKFALIARGFCNFTEKLANAEAAGAEGAIVYSTDEAPIVMGGDGSVDIPAVMIKNSGGVALLNELLNGATVSANMTINGIAEDNVEIGNIMSASSSLGPNPQSGDVIKPDITAPGTRILAATSFDQVNDVSDGENFAYLSGTSMSGPHIAGMIALLKEQYPDWSTSALKSAIMTTAYQNVFKSDGTTPATPFDFGSGHAAPVAAMDPGLVYDANFGDYLAFLCGQGSVSLAETLSASTCEDIAAQGFALDASQLNYPSIAIEELTGEETVFRTVTDVTGAGGEYTISVVAPAGISVTVSTFDSEGNETEEDTLVVEANGRASYGLTFSAEDDAVVGEFAFGSVTLSDGNGHVVYSPIAIQPGQTVKIDNPEAVSVDLNSRGRGRFPVQMLYSGTTSIEAAGLAAQESFSSFAEAGEPFTFGTVFAKGFYIPVPENAEFLRVRLTEDMVSVPDADIDLWLIYCNSDGCSVPATSQNVGNNEDITLLNPNASPSADPNDAYILYMRPFDTAGEASVEYTVDSWVVAGQQNGARISASTRAIEGRFNNVSISARGLAGNSTYMGIVTFFDENGEEQGSTLIEANTP